MQQRRNFIQKLTFTGMGMLGLSSLSTAQTTRQSAPKIPKNTTMLFQGDSITDARRNKKQQHANQSYTLGGGYVHQIASHFLGNYPETNLNIYNRGISGNKVFQLANRWEKDCLEIKPDLLSILIGVNDYWHTLSHDYKGTVETYNTDLRKLLDTTLKALPDVKLILAEPFMLKDGTAIDESKWVPQFQAYQEANQAIAKAYKATYIPLQSIFDEALATQSVEYWCPDGVHPSLAGNYLMAQAWIKAIERIYS